MSRNQIFTFIGLYLSLGWRPTRSE